MPAMSRIVGIPASMTWVKCGRSAPVPVEVGVNCRGQDPALGVSPKRLS
jgi:hypothetical protein